MPPVSTRPRSCDRDLVRHETGRLTSLPVGRWPPDRMSGVRAATLQSMVAAEAWAKQHGMPKLQLMVRSDNTAVLDFYAHLGYESQDVAVLGRRF